MARPTKDKKSGIFLIRLKVPADIREQVGKIETGKSLRTRDPDEARRRWAEAYLAYQREWQAIRTGPEAIPHKQLVALAGESYRDAMAMLDDEPGTVGVWQAFHGLNDRVGSSKENLRQWYGATADQILRSKGLNADAASYDRLIDELHRAAIQWAEQQHKRSEGDYSPDPQADRFPAWQDPIKRDTPSVSLSDLFALWERDHLADGKSPRTVTDFRHKVASLIEYLGHDNAHAVEPINIADWCSFLRHEQGISGRTVSQKYLAAVKVMFRVAVEKQRLSSNPAASVTERYSKARRTRSKGFTDAEAVAILNAALVDPAELGRRSALNKRAIRWGPWICAFTGARITEVMQMRSEDLIVVGGIPCLRITPEAGSVKSGAYRVVPVHPQLIEMGLVDLIHSLPPGPVFYSSAPHRGKAADPVERAQAAGGKVGQWVRAVVGITDDVQPNHGWRHRFKTVGRDVAIGQEYLDVMQGHEDGRAASDYGETTVKALWREIQKLPYIRV
ncbi:DUF6538 domain-containing protein [uncultured Paracoccus sp.]|uniref:DUF6538 domain-containing protein n=1 Tax=uncultured Paracoccus sp. TaxID=189685 RepID=UPI002609AE99|nr:DUF6538 domain-containing protein [uncultured Paracoccus sp.]